MRSTLLLAIIMIGCLSSAQPSWEDLGLAIKQRRMHQYARTVQKQAEYQDFKRMLVQNNLTLPLHVKRSIFGYGSRAKESIYPVQSTNFHDQSISVYVQTNDPSKVDWIALQIHQQDVLEGLSEDSHFILLKLNDFPYYLDASIEHWVLWSNQEIELPLVQQITAELTAESYQTLVYVNEPNYKSIPEIFHAQMFVRKRLIADSQL